MEELQSNIIITNTKTTAYREETEIRFDINGIYEIPFTTSAKFNHSLINYRKDSANRKKTIELEINFESLVSEIFISPYCSSWQKNIL